MIYAGVDIGGTNIKLGLIEKLDDKAIIRAKTLFAFEKIDYRITCKKIADTIRDLLSQNGYQEQDLNFIGLSVPGCVDNKGETLVHAFNIDYHNVPLKSEIQKHFPDKRILMDNDANCAAIAELYGGAFLGKKSALLLTLGTGLGGGFIINGKIFNGGQNHGFELGHMPFRDGDRPCTCGKKGCMETYCNTKYLIDRGTKEIGPEYNDARIVIEAAKNGNQKALNIYNDYVDNLAIILSGLCSMLDPEIVALGGGISMADHGMYKTLEEKVAKMNFFRCSYKIVPAVMGNDAGIVGAAMLGE